MSKAGDKRKKTPEDLTKRDTVLGLLRNRMTKKKAENTIRAAMLEFPDCGKGVRQCDNCRKIVTPGNFHIDVPTYDSYTVNVCTDCCFWCYTCEEQFDKDGAYKHKYLCKTCKWDEYDKDEAVDSPDSESSDSEDKKSESGSVDSSNSDFKVCLGPGCYVAIAIKSATYPFCSNCSSKQKHKPLTDEQLKTIVVKTDSEEEAVINSIVERVPKE